MDVIDGPGIGREMRSGSQMPDVIGVEHGGGGMPDVASLRRGSDSPSPNADNCV